MNENEKLAFWSSFFFGKLPNRINRIEFLALNSLWLIVMMILSGVSFGIFFLAKSFVDSHQYTQVWQQILTYSAFLILPIAFILLGFVQKFRLMLKRAHDFNCGVWLILLIIGLGFLNPVNHLAGSLAFLFSLTFYFYPGCKGENKFGEQPQQAKEFFKVIALIVPLAFAVTFILTAISAIEHPDPKKEKFHQYSTDYYSVKFPNTYKVIRLKNTPLPLTLIYSRLNDTIFKIYALNASKNPILNLNDFLANLGIKELPNHKLDISNKKLLMRLFNRHNSELLKGNIKTVSSKDLIQDGIPGYFLKAQFNKHGRKVGILAKVLLDRKNERLYFILAYYFGNNKTGKPEKLAKTFLNAFKLKKYMLSSTSVTK